MSRSGPPFQVGAHGAGTCGVFAAAGPAIGVIDDDENAVSIGRVFVTSGDGEHVRDLVPIRVSGDEVDLVIADAGNDSTIVDRCELVYEIHANGQAAAPMSDGAFGVYASVVLPLAATARGGAVPPELVAAVDGEGVASAAGRGALDLVFPPMDCGRSAALVTMGGDDVARVTAFTHRDGAWSAGGSMLMRARNDSALVLIDVAGTGNVSVRVAWEGEAIVDRVALTCVDTPAATVLSVPPLWGWSTRSGDVTGALSRSGGAVAGLGGGQALYARFAVPQVKDGAYTAFVGPDGAWARTADGEPGDTVSFDVSPPGVRLLVQPNPQRGRATVTISVGDRREVALDVFDAAGRRVARVLGGLLEVGTHEIVWDGRDAAGRVVAPGVYFAMLRAGDQRHVTRIVRLAR